MGTHIKKLVGRPIGINLEPTIKPVEGNPQSIPWTEGVRGNCRKG